MKKSVSESLKLKYAFYIDIKKAWRHAAGAKNVYRLFYVCRGSMKISCHMKTLQICQNQAIILPLNERISTAKSAEGGICFYEFGIDLPIISLPLGTVLNSQNPLETSQLLCLIYENFHRGNSSCNCLCNVLLTYLQNTDVNSFAEWETVQLIRNYVNAHIAEDIRIDSLAESLNCSRSSLDRAFSAVTNKSLKAYINEQRLAYICSLLEYSDFTVNQIASLSGFDDANLFTKFFSYHTGLSPSDYRRQLYNIPLIHDKNNSR